MMISESRMAKLLKDLRAKLLEDLRAELPRMIARVQAKARIDDENADSFARLVAEADAMVAPSVPTPAKPNDVWLSVGDAARHVRVATGTISNAVKTGRLVSNGQVGAHRRIERKSLEAWAKTRATRPRTGKTAPKPARPGPAPTAKTTATTPAQSRRPR